MLRKFSFAGLAGFGAALLAAGPAFSQEIDLTMYAGQEVTPVYAGSVQQPSVDLSNPGPGFGGADDNLDQTVSIDVSTQGSTSLDFCAAVVNHGTNDRVVVKVQQQDGSGKFSHVGFYHTNGTAGGWPGMTGGAAFFALAAPDQFTSARMHVSHDNAGNVVLRLTNVVGGTNNQVYMRGGWTTQPSNACGIGQFSGIFNMDNFGVAYPGDALCDPFNRAALGPDWVNLAGNATIVGNAYNGTNNSVTLYRGPCRPVADVHANIATNGTLSGYAALVANYDGANNLYIKVQQQGGSGAFDNIGFYQGVNGGGWPGITGGPAFFAIDPADQFRIALARVTLDETGVVRLILSDTATNSGVLEYQRGGWQILNGRCLGMGGWQNNASMDNFGSGGMVLDDFNRPNGPLGPDWNVTNGTGQVLNNEARGGGLSRSIYTPSCGVQCDPCDTNCDGVVDAFDIEPFINLLVGPGQPCSPCAGDADGNGVIDAFDIEPFINCLVGP